MKKILIFILLVGLPIPTFAQKKSLPNDLRTIRKRSVEISKIIMKLNDQLKKDPGNEHIEAKINATITLAYYAFDNMIGTLKNKNYVLELFKKVYFYMRKSNSEHDNIAKFYLTMRIVIDFCDLYLDYVKK